MAYRTKTFEVKLESEKAQLSFGIRMAVVDYIRGEIRERLAKAADAGIDRQTVVQRFGLTFAGTARGYRLPRAIPSALVQWAGFVEYNEAGENGYPAAAPHSVGAFGASHVQELTGNVVVAKMGGLSFAGICEGGLPADICEVRIAW